MDQQISQAALDSFQMAEPRIGRVQLRHQLDDTILEMAERVAAAAALLNLLDLVGEQLHQRFQPRQYRGSALGALCE